MPRLQGNPVSPGVAIGRACPVDRRRVKVPRYHLEVEQIPAELGRLDAAFKLSLEQLTAIRQSLGEGEQGAILDAHRMMIEDPTLQRAAVELVRDELNNAEWAVRRVFRDFADKLGAATEAHLAERRADLDEVCDRVVHNLSGERPSVLAELPPPGSILIVHDLPTADAAVLLSGGRVAGLVCDFGSKTSHTAILARALEVPCVTGAGTAVELARPGELVALDGDTGEVLIGPDAEDLQRLELVRARQKSREAELLEDRDLPATTLDGRRIALVCNIEFPEEVPSVLAHGGEGIGLYRTEFLYLEREELPSEEEHYTAYREILERMQGRPVTIRTLDLGGDKLPIGHRSHEANPSLGLRAIRLTLKHPQLFRTQLRALWRASVHGQLRVMLPMIASVSELREAKALLAAAREELVRDGLWLPDRLPVGIMLETPAAALVADRLARECDFFSIGTNDLIQYALAADRGNKDVAYLYRPMHLGVLRLIQSAVEGARAGGIEVAMCGEMAGDPRWALVLLALGLDTLSMNPADVPKVKKVLRASELRDARELLDAAMCFSSTDEIEGFVRREVERRFPGLGT